MVENLGAVPDMGQPSPQLKPAELLSDSQNPNVAERSPESASLAAGAHPGGEGDA